MKQPRKVLISLLLLALLLALPGCAGHGDGFIPMKSSGGSEAESGKITTLEINQGLSYTQDENGDPVLLENLVSSRDTVVFVKMAQDTEPDLTGGSQTLEVYRDDTLVGTWQPAAQSDAGRLCFPITGADVEKLLPGEYTFTVSVSGEIFQRQVTLTETAPLRLLIVPIRAHYAGEVVEPVVGWEGITGLLERSWPVSGDQLTINVQEELDLSGGYYDLCTESGEYNAWLALKNLMGALDSTYDAVIGYVSGPMGTQMNQDLYAAGDGAFIVSSTATSVKMLVAHQVAHSLGLGDEYEGGALNLETNPPVQGVSGYDRNENNAAVTCDTGIAVSASEAGLVCAGNLVSETLVPFDAEAMLKKGNCASFLSGEGESDENYWITAQVWDALFEALTAGTGAAEPTLHLRGTLNRSGNFSPLQLFQNTAVLSQYEAGDYVYSLIFYNAAGEEVYTHGFTPSFLSAGIPPTEQQQEFLDFQLPLPDGAVKLSLYGPVYAAGEDGNPDLTSYTVDEIWTTSISETSPTAAFSEITPAEGDARSLSVSWSSTAGEGVSLWYELFLMQDGMAVQKLYAGTDTAVTAVIPADFSAGNASLLLLCTGGGRSVEVLSDPFSVQ